MRGYIGTAESKKRGRGGERERFTLQKQVVACPLGT